MTKVWKILSVEPEDDTLRDEFDIEFKNIGEAEDYISSGFIELKNYVGGVTIQPFWVHESYEEMQQRIKKEKG